MDLSNIRIGTASAGLQIEGSPRPNNWSEWVAKDGTTPHPTTDHWRRWREDNQLMSDLGLQIARVGVEWSRVEPEPGRYDHDALQRYREEFLDLRERGIEPLVTLHHFGHPAWFEANGAFTRESNVEIFLRYVDVVLDHLGDVVTDWITINEPNVFATEAYLFGSTPPGRGGLPKVRPCLRNMAAAHILAYQRIHSRLDNPRVTFAHHRRVFAPMNPRNPIHRLLTPLVEWLFQGAIEPAFFEGRFHPVLGHPSLELPSGGVFADAVAINYYSRTAVRGFSDATFPGTPTNDLGWEIYPPGIAEVSAELAKRYQLPVWITENGTADAAERFRCAFILDHLAELSRVPEVERYYHWCFVDNWEWSEGMAQKFGVVDVDRQIKPAGRLLQALIREGAITPEIDAKFREKGQ